MGCIRPESLNEIRALKSPPEVIRDILEGALRLMGIQDTSWNSMKAFLGKRGVTQDIVQFDARKIAKKARKAVEDLLKKKERSFDPVVCSRYKRKNSQKNLFYFLFRARKKLHKQRHLWLIGLEPKSNMPMS